jgi:hypothetical protein
MPASLLTDLADMMADTLKAQPVVDDGTGTGAVIASGAALLMPAYISGRVRRVRDLAGQEVVSSVKAIVGVTPALVAAWVALGWSGWVDEDWVSGADAYPSILTVEGYRFVLPSRFEPRGDEGGQVGLKALAVHHASDENGAHHEVVYFP